jgi:hypothetical protein
MVTLLHQAPLARCEAAESCSLTPCSLTPPHRWPRSEAFEGAVDPFPTPVHHVGIHHRRLPISVSEEFLHRADRIAIFPQGRGACVPSRVAVGWLRQPSFARGLVGGSWSHRCGQLMTPGLTGPWIQADRCGREHPPPAPCSVGMGRLPWPCVRPIDPAAAWRHVALVPLAHAAQMRRQRIWHSRWRYRAPILMTLARTNHTLGAGAVTVFHSATQIRQQAPAGPLEEAGHKPGDACLSAEPRFAL